MSYGHKEDPTESVEWQLQKRTPGASFLDSPDKQTERIMSSFTPKKDEAPDGFVITVCVILVVMTLACATSMVMWAGHLAELW